MPSLRRKILSAYGYSKLVMLIFAGVVFADLHYLDRQIRQGQAVSDLRETILELRRDEKNLFLYGTSEDYADLRAQLTRAQQALSRGQAAFLAIVPAQTVARLQHGLAHYHALIERYPGDTPAQRLALQTRIRALGHELGEISRVLAHEERAILAAATRHARVLLLVTLGVVVLLGAVGGLYLVWRVVRPLEALQAGLSAIDSGRARELVLPSQDREIRAFVAAFNALLRHMRRQQEQARRREKAAALGILVSGVAHELNNPLSNVSTAVQLLMEEGDTADADTRARWLAQIDGETERARRIVRRLLDSVRPPRPSRQAVPLPELFARTLALVERQLPPGVSVCVGAVEEVVLQADRERLQQVLINLIKNAAEAGAQRIVLTAGIAIWDEEAAEGAQLQGDPAGLAQAERAVRILVEDDGCGMPGEVLTHIFEPFYTTRGAGEGTGLGLYLVQEIVAEHGGLILAESTPGRGSRFTVWLPLGAEETA